MPAAEVHVTNSSNQPAFALPAYKRVREQAFKLAEETRKKKLEQLARPLTEEEKPKAQAFAVKLISALQNSESAQVHSMMDRKRHRKRRLKGGECETWDGRASHVYGQESIDIETG